MYVVFMETKLTTYIRKACDECEMKVTTFGRKYVGDTRFVERLESGGQCLPRTEKKAREGVQLMRQQYRVKMKKRKG